MVFSVFKSLFGVLCSSLGARGKESRKVGMSSTPFEICKDLKGFGI